MRKIAELLLVALLPDRDAFGVERYLETGTWSYPKAIMKFRGTRRAWVTGLELVYLAQTIRDKMFYRPTMKKLRKNNAFMPTHY